MAHARVAVATSVFFVAACSGAPSAAPPVVPAETAPAAPGSFDGAAWATFHSKRFELSLRFPDGPAWKIDDHRTPWLRATHERTRSKIVLRSWREDDNVTRSGCYARARGWDPALPDLDTSRLLEDGLRTVGNHDARVVVGISGGPDAPLGAGFVIAVVGEVRRCLLLAYQTEPSGGAAAEEDVAGRLAVIADRLLPTLKVDQSFAPSREPAIPSRPAGGAGGVR